MLDFLLLLFIINFVSKRLRNFYNKKKRFYYFIVVPEFSFLEIIKTFHF